MERVLESYYIKIFGNNYTLGNSLNCLENLNETPRFLMPEKFLISKLTLVFTWS